MAQTNQEDFFDELKEWSGRKLQLLDKYLEAASKIMGSIKQVYYLDGFAGAGTYDDNSKGSSVRAAELALRYKQESKPYSLKCINIEENSKRFANLQAATVIFGNLVLNLNGTFVENIDKILQEVRNQPVICFLDPFGIKGIDWSVVKKLIHRGPYALTDLWIRFDTQIMSRLYGFFDSKTLGADKKFEILPRVFGIEDKVRLHSLLAGKTSEERFQNALSLYERNLAESFSAIRGAGFAASYPIRSLNGQCKYYLVFATAHEKGATLASEIVYGIEETYQRELQEFKEMQPQQLSLFSAEPTEEEIFLEKVEHLKKDIWEACKGKNLSRMEVYINIWEKWFGRIKGKHINAALKDLKNNGFILEISGPISKENSRITFKT